MTVTPTRTDVLTVAQYSTRIVRALQTVGGGVVEGEVLRPKSTSRGMLFFTLTDGHAELSCKVFGSQVRGLQHQPQHGDLVQVRIDRPDFWTQAGKLDVIVSDIRLAGEGELLRRREQLLRQLQSEGLCDPARRRPLPRFPRAVGIIAGRDSAGMRDVVDALVSRFPPVHIVTCAAVVQGARAPRDIIDALARLDAHPPVDVIVIARGGGSVRDLIAFDDEGLCRAVFACGTPVVAAIGHTDNIPVCNHVAWASETPSRSPELAVPSAEGLRRDVELAAAGLAHVPQRARALAEQVGAVRLDVSGRLHSRGLEVASAASALRDAEHRFFDAREDALGRAREALARVPGRLPDPNVVTAVGASLDVRAAAFFTERSHDVRAIELTTAVEATLVRHATAVDVSVRGLDVVSATLAEHARDVVGATVDAAAVQGVLDERRAFANDHGRQIASGIRKELADYLVRYGRELPQSAAVIRLALLRLLAQEREHVQALGAHAGDDVRRRLVEAERAVRHITDVLAASDPRGRGWVLPTNSDGAVVRSVRALAPGDHLTLSFHDGVAGAVIDHTPQQEHS